MKKLTALVLAILLMFSISACSSPEIITTPHGGYLLTPGIICTVDDNYSYKVISYTGSKTSVVAEAEALVREWWGDDSTFRVPEIVWVDIISGNIRGFQDVGYLFLDPHTTRDDLLATTVHEWIHELVDPGTLIDLEVEGEAFGRPVMEMVVESITIDILGDMVEIAPASVYEYFEKTPELWNHRSELQEAYKNQEGFSAYERILGENYLQIIHKAYSVW